jgi:hypothetical protein
VDTTGCFAGDIRCGFIGDGLSEINLSVAVRGFLMGVVSPEICSSLLAAAGTELKFGHNTLNNLNTHYNALKCLSMITC